MLGFNFHILRTLKIKKEKSNNKNNKITSVIVEITKEIGLDIAMLL